MNNKEELRDLLARIEPSIKLRKITIVTFFIGVILASGMNMFAHPEYTQGRIIPLIIWFISAYVFEFLVKKQKTSSGASNLYLGYSAIIELGLLSIIVFNSGGMEWVGAIFYLFTIIYSNIILSKPKGLVVSLAAIIWYGGLVSLQCLGLIPFRPYFDLGVSLYRSPNYFLTTLLFVILTFLLAGLATGIFTDLLRKKTRELAEARAFLEKTKADLEIRVENRTKELKELAKSLDEQVQQRTKELQELTNSLKQQVEERTKELQKRVDELETFRGLTVGREMKMIELKKEIEELKEELKKAEKLKNISNCKIKDK